MTRARLIALLTALLLSASTLNAAPDFAAGFLNPPADCRILKIIHSWPDDPGAQDRLTASLAGQGFGGVVCNVSFTDYLQSDGKWQAFCRAVERAKTAGFALWLYDEKGYPSGSAGGLVLRNHPEWEAHGLLVADVEVAGGTAELEVPPGELMLVCGFQVRDGKLHMESRTNLVAHLQAGKLSWQSPPGRWRVIAITGDRLYEGTHASGNLADHIPYPNLLDPEPTARFLELTHEAYAKHLGDDLGRYFMATFTDEPSLMSLFLRPMPYRPLPWSPNLVTAFQQQCGYRIEDKLPSLIVDTGSDTARVRYDYWNTVGTMVADNFFGQIQAWCRRHDILSGGHLLMEENLVNQVPLYGDFFRCLRRLDAPSIDCLTSIPEQVPWYIARLAGSAADLEKRGLTMCETSDHSQRYRPAGDNRPVRKVTEEEIRGTCNRLMVGGIDCITSYYSFDGLDTAQLRRLNEYIGRCCFALKGGYRAADIAVLYPVESVWIRFTPARHYANDSAGATRIENIWRDVSESLFGAGYDFTYADSRALAESRVEQGALLHGDLRWRVVVLPGADTLPLRAWENLSAFVESGGVLLSVGALPVNSEQEFPSPKVKELAARIFHAAKELPSIHTNSNGGMGIFLPPGLATLTPDVLSRILLPDFQTGQGNSALRYTHRNIDGKEVYFVINDSKETWQGKISLSVEGAGQQWDPATGSHRELTSGKELELEVPPYGGTVLTFAKAERPGRVKPDAELLPGLTVRELSMAEPTVARGEFVREELRKIHPPRGVTESSPTAPDGVWEATGKLTKGQVDTFLFLGFKYASPLDLRKARALVVDSWVPENQLAPAQLLLILHEKGGADYLAQSGRLLNASGHESTWVAVDRFQLAGWSQDKNAKLDLEDISEIRVGWGGYFGKEGECIGFAVAQPSAAFETASNSSEGRSGKPELSAASVDLRSEFERFGLARRTQGKRPTCSVFTVAGALEFAAARRQGRTPRLSVDFLNWAANRTCGDHQDGGFFSDLWKGFARFGIATETAMPYSAAYDPECVPNQGAMDDARTRLELGLRLHWIKEWDVKTGLTESEFNGIKQTLQEGWPVCGGFRWPVHEQWENQVLQMCQADAVRDGHSILLVGYRDDVTQPGGGVFIFRNTAGHGQDGFMPYAYAREYMNDAVWVDCDAAALPASAP